MSFEEFTSVPALWLDVRLLLLLAIANNAPIGAKLLLGARWSAPLDGGRRFIDGNPLLGPSKTLRGVLAAFIGAGAVGPLLGFSLPVSLEVGAVAMLGDALASFAKRRWRVAPSGRATGIDQIPEALLPLLAVRDELGLAWLQVVAITLAFFVLEIPLARLAYYFGLRDRPH